jgi:hypothetical protein
VQASVSWKPCKPWRVWGKSPEFLGEDETGQETRLCRGWVPVSRNAPAAGSPSAGQEHMADLPPARDSRSPEAINHSVEPAGDAHAPPRPADGLRPPGWPSTPAPRCFVEKVRMFFQSNHPEDSILGHDVEPRPEAARVSLTHRPFWWTERIATDQPRRARAQVGCLNALEYGARALRAAVDVADKMSRLIPKSRCPVIPLANSEVDPFAPPGARPRTRPWA